mgnify:FL=1
MSHDRWQERVTDLRVELAERADLSRIPQLKRYFQALDGGYAEGDRFLGVRVPDCRKVARSYRYLPLDGITELLRSAYHEERLIGLLIMVNQYEKADHEGRWRLVQHYIEHRRGVNNWDLVDSSADKLLGRFVLEGGAPESIIDELAASESLWDNRIAMISTFAFIREGRFELPLRIAALLLHHPEDLIHKAVGWMLREISNRDPEVGVSFLEAHASEMPRTMLRYAIEKLPKRQRDRWLRRR